MARFNTAAVKTAPTFASTPITGSSVPSTLNAAGVPGYTRDPKSELFLLAVSCMGDNTFYESADDRSERLVRLVWQLASETQDGDLDWLRRFLPWLRREAHMRTASLVAGVEACRIAAKNGHSSAAASIADSVMIRADEPGEALAYWRSTHGRVMPRALKRALASAIRRLYTQRAFLKYDSTQHGYRFADVLNLVHPVPKDASQAALFRYITATRYRPDAAVPLALETIRANKATRAALRQSVDGPVVADVQALKKAGLTWEDTSSLAGEVGADKKAMWESTIPSMGYMALLRNLRNFDIAGVSNDVATEVALRLVDPAQIAASKQLPFRFHSAYQACGSDRWSWALSRALNTALANIPVLAGRTLVLVDQSPSMFRSRYWSQPMRRDHQETGRAPHVSAALFGSAVALRAQSADLFGFGLSSYRVEFAPGDSVLKTMKKFREENGTDITGAVAANFHASGAGRHDRIVIITDEQSTVQGWTGRAAPGMPGFRGYYDAAGRVAPTINQVVPAEVPVYVWNLGGYGVGHLPHAGNRFVFGGVSDAAFGMISMLEMGKDATWPF